MDLSRLRTQVTVFDDDATRSRVSTDFGGIVKRVPCAVIVPRSANDVRRTLEFACHERCTVAVRGAGHSQAGQSLSSDGLQLDMTKLNRIGQIENSAIWVQGGVTWRDIVQSVRAQGYVPPVLTTNLNATIGGTLSTGGFGASSHKYGTQTDNVEELLVVTGDTNVKRCSRAENPELFDCVRAGFGQFAVIISARIRLRKKRPHVYTFLLAYDDVETLLQDQQAAIAYDRIEYITTICVPRSLVGLESFLSRRSPFDSPRFVMKITVESDRTIDASSILEGLDRSRLLTTTDGQQQDLPFDADWRGPEGWNDWSLAHPWIEGILPSKSANNCITELLTQMPPFLPRDTILLIWSAPRDRFNVPMLALPDDEWLTGIAVLPALKPTELNHILPSMESLGELMTEMGGKRYLSGWIDYDYEQWRRHFGELWPQIAKWKSRFDPNLVLNPELIRYSPNQEDDTVDNVVEK